VHGSTTDLVTLDTAELTVDGLQIDLLVT